MELINNSIFQSMFLSPIMGVVFSLIFSFFIKRQREEITVKETKIIIIERIEDLHYQKRKRKDEIDARVLIICIIFITIVSIWFYAANQYIILYYYFEVSYFSLFFLIMVGFFAFLKNQFSSRDWWLYIGFYLIMIFLAMIFIVLTYRSADNNIIELANSSKNSVDFFFNKLNFYGKIYYFFDVVKLLLITILLFINILGCVYYYSLMFARTESPLQLFFINISIITKKFGKIRKAILSIITCIFIISIQNEYLIDFIYNFLFQNKISNN